MLDNIRYDQRYDSLLVVYRFGSYTAAARNLSLTPSAVSQQIHSVERELGTTLFIRSKNRLTPTAECELVVGSIQKIQAVCKQISDGIDLSHRHLERLCVGITPSAENYALTGVLSALTGSRLPIQLKVTSGTSEELCDKLKNYEIDIAVIDFPEPDSPTRAKIFPFSSSKETLCKTLNLPDCRLKKTFKFSIFKSVINRFYFLLVKNQVAEYTDFQG